MHALVLANTATQLVAAADPKLGIVMASWKISAALLAKNVHDHFTNGPFSNHFFTYYAVVAQLWHWMALALAASGGSGACLSGDTVCEVVTQVLVFAGSPQRSLPTSVETSFELLMAVWIVAIVAIVASELLR